MNDFSPSEFWKNFRLGTELSISGSFLYNGLIAFDQMQHFYYEDEAFEFLYNISVGVERLQKICVVLLEHNDSLDQEKFEESLITHNHNELNKRIQKQTKINFGKSHKKFLNVLTKFYKSSRYELFQKDSVYNKNQSKEELIKFISDSLDIKISTDFFGCTRNDLRIKKFIGNIIGKLSSEYYNIVRNECNKLNIYTYEIHYESKAFKIFMSKEYDFFNEKIIQKEILKYLFQTKLPEKFKDYLDEQPSLDIGFYSINSYIDYLLCYHKKQNIKGEFSDIYSELKNIKERFNHLEIIGNPEITLDDEEEEDND